MFAFFMQMEGTKSDSFVQGITEAADELGARVILHGALTNAAFMRWDQRYLQRRLFFESTDFDGVGFSACGSDLQHYGVECQEAGKPSVLVARRKGEVPSVICENRGAFRLVVRQLAERGHRRIAYLSGPTEIYTAQERLAGYREGLADAALEFDPGLVVQGDYQEGTARAATKRLIETGVTFTALIAANDVSALGAMSVLQVMGRQIPADVEVIGFDNIPRSRWSHPSLSTFDLELFQQGYVAMEVVMRQARREPLPRQHTIVPTAYVERGSTRRSTPSTSLGAVFTAEWPEERFRSGVHLARLLRDAEAAAAVAQLQRPDCASQEFSEALAVLLARQSALKVNASCLYPLFHDTKTSASGGERSGEKRVGPLEMEQARGLLSAASFEEQRRRAETAILFASATAALHELLVQSADEATIIERLRGTLRNLCVRSAGLFLHPPTRNDEDRPVAGGQWWDLSEDVQGSTGDPIELAGFSLKERMASKPWTTLVVMPLTHGEEQFGLLILEAGGEFVVHYPDLVRDLATVVYGSRTHFALAAANRELEVAAADLAKSYDALRSSEYFYHSLVESLPQLIVRKDAAGVYTYSNKGFSELIGRPVDQIIGRKDEDLFPPETAARLRAEGRSAMDARRPLEHENVVEVEGGKKRYFHVKLIPLYGQEQDCLGVQVIAWDMTVFRETEQLLRDTQRELIETSRLAGIAEVATGVLHNIGNVITSVNTAVNIVIERVQGSKISGVKRLAELISSQAERLPEFFASDPRGRQVPAYLQQLSERLFEEQNFYSREFELMQRKVEAINAILAAQENFVRVEPVNETIAPAELLEHALRINEASLHRQIMTVTREFQDVPLVRVQRHKLLQILVNLIRNAEEAMEEIPTPGDRRLSLSLVLTANGNVQIGVTDSGGGILAENLTRIFAFGFTTKRDGHGFSLHTNALAAKEMGGTLTAMSPGPGKGSTFLLELPPAAPLREGPPVLLPLSLAAPSPSL